jgi:5-methylcytosine-specific restriction endonuclease McrA
MVAVRPGAAGASRGKALGWAGRDKVRNKDMPKARPPKEVWLAIRQVVWTRDQGRCRGPYCADTPPWSLALNECHIDHIRSGKHGTNELSNLRTLCRKCHVLRADMRHRGMMAQAIADGIIPADWRPLVWDD